MSSITKYLKMNNTELEEEIKRQNKKIANAKETIALLKKLQIAANLNAKKHSTPVPIYKEGGD